MLHNNSLILIQSCRFSLTEQNSANESYGLLKIFLKKRWLLKGIRNRIIITRMGGDGVRNFLKFRFQITEFSYKHPLDCKKNAQ